MLDGYVVHQYSLTGEQGPDVRLATSPPTSAGVSLLTRIETRKDQVLVVSSGSESNVLDVLLFETDGSHRALTLPLADGAAPLMALAVAPERGDGWLRLLYQSANETDPAAQRHFVFASAYRLPE